MHRHKGSCDPNEAKRHRRSHNQHQQHRRSTKHLFPPNKPVHSLKARRHRRNADLLQRVERPQFENQNDRKFFQVPLAGID